ncbi:hypothetical protein AMAG_07618 [Allomyces macrogynus ATCC 38327]|uniref:Uncharacterized protein n=1 Tax=Allomyces macrogynus (strain ATCC 38327) TaxID=578462 RepID=A0A0L0SIR0_ALLM3|nr:hypothetical protein AMAG_07618 [Allomyces macrogynus ATCC 38327]|eukprot:KNE62396.1 hypothetical protein AMAG_07618 [Allomyces macrogynus ATCC 38327]
MASLVIPACPPPSTTASQLASAVAAVAAVRVAQPNASTAPPTPRFVTQAVLPGAVPVLVRAGDIVLAVPVNADSNQTAASSLEYASVCALLIDAQGGAWWRRQALLPRVAGTHVHFYPGAPSPRWEPLARVSRVVVSKAALPAVAAAAAAVAAAGGSGAAEPTSPSPSQPRRYHPYLRAKTPTSPTRSSRALTPPHTPTHLHHPTPSPTPSPKLLPPTLVNAPAPGPLMPSTSSTASSPVLPPLALPAPAITRASPPSPVTPSRGSIQFLLSPMDASADLGDDDVEVEDDESVSATVAIRQQDNVDDQNRAAAALVAGDVVPVPTAAAAAANEEGPSVSDALLLVGFAAQAARNS